jgi:hypothetical protein
MRLLTRYCHVNGYLFKVRLIDSASFGKCKQAIETASHAPCDCKALATLRIKHLGQNFLKPGEFEDVPISKIPLFIQNIGLCECVRKGAAQKKWIRVEVYMSQRCPPLCILF